MLLDGNEPFFFLEHFISLGIFQHKSNMEFSHLFSQCTVKISKTKPERMKNL